MVEKRGQLRLPVPARPGAGQPLDGRRGTTPFAHPAMATRAAAPSSDSLLTVMWRSRWMMLLCLVLALVAGFVYIQTVTPIFTSTSKLYLDYGSIQISQPYEPGRPPRTDKYLYTQAELLKSRPILAAALETLDPRRMRTFANVDVIPVAHLHRTVTVDVGKKDEIISVSFDSVDPVEVSEIVNRIVEAYMTSRSEQEQRNSAQVLRILQADMTRTNEELKERLSQLEHFQTHEMPLSRGSEQGGSVIMQQCLDLQAAHTQAEFTAVEAESFYEGVRTLAENPAALRQYLQAKGGAGSYSYGGATAERARLEAQLTELDISRQKLLETVTPDHPSVAGMGIEIEGIQTQLGELDRGFVEAAMAAAEQQFSEAKRYEQQVAQRHTQQEQQVALLSQELAQYQRLRSEVDRLSAYSETLDEQVREIRKIVGEDVGQLRMEILEPALRAERPSKPQKARVMAMALVLGLLSGGGIALARDWFDQTLRSAEEISAALGLPVLGLVPAMSRRDKADARGRRVLLRPESHEAEAFRTVRTAIFFGAPKDRTRTMLVTSPSAAEGKSTLVSNLGIAIARAGQKTLILDADFRKPTQHTIFGLDHRERSLSGVLSGKKKLGEAIQRTPVKGLSLLVCGYNISNPAEFLNSPRFAKLLECLAGAYDRVLVDAPPATIVTDAQILGALCDVTVLVLKADKSTRKIAQQAIDALQSVGAHLLGVVVNEVHKSGGRYGYYGGYNQSYGSDVRNGKSSRRRDTKAGPEGRRAAVSLVSKGR